MATKRQRRNKRICLCTNVAINKLIIPLPRGYKLDRKRVSADVPHETSAAASAGALWTLWNYLGILSYESHDVKQLYDE